VGKKVMVSEAGLAVGGVVRVLFPCVFGGRHETEQIIRHAVVKLKSIRLSRQLFRAIRTRPRLLTPSALHIHPSRLQSTKMATLDDKSRALLQQSFPQAVELEGDMIKLSSSLFPQAAYSTNEKTEIEQWLITSSHMSSSTEDAAKTAERLSSLNTHLSTRTTLLGSKPSVADIALYARLAPVIASWSNDQRTGEQGYHHIVRHADFVQNSPLFALKIQDVDKVNIDQDNVIFNIKPIDLKAEKERKKKEKELAAQGATSAANAGATVTSAASPEAQQKPTTEQLSKKADGIKENVKATGDKIADAVAAETPAAMTNKKTEKKAKKEKAPKAPAVPEKPFTPALIDLRVGHILKCIRHPNADSLFVSTINVGDAPGTDNTEEYEGQTCRTVCSGLNGLVPLEEMQGRKIVAVCNLKPVTMRGIKSSAMVLAASPRLKEGEQDNHAGPVELVNLPSAAVAGDRVYFDGYEGEPEAVLNPKKKIWEAFQPGFTTTESLEVAFEVSAVAQLVEKGDGGVRSLKTKSGVCTVKSLSGAIVR
jgi:aminoacyl tRNA synthase complex-interacting multifunctional protein 1